MWRRRTDRWPCCPSLSNPRIDLSLWGAWPDGYGRRDNRMAAQHLSRDLVPPSSGYKLAQTMEKNLMSRTFWRWVVRNVAVKFFKAITQEFFLLMGIIWWDFMSRQSSKYLCAHQHLSKNFDSSLPVLVFFGFNQPNLMSNEQVLVVG